MGDIKLLILDFLTYFNFFIINLSSNLLDVIDPQTQLGLKLTSANFFFMFNQNLAFFFAIKFCGCIAFLILIRGGAPRYRYDYLTKLG